MIPNLAAREIEQSGVTASGAFGISLKDSAHIMTILRDTLYSDKVLAVLREYSSNAWDAHRMVGKDDLPIKVILPTLQDPTLTIQDFGPGLSHLDVFEVYTQYGASTKRGSDKAVGMLGIGSKSGFAYSDSFTIVSAHEGKRRTYVAVLDESEKGRCDLLDERDCEAGETGITIKIPIKPEDIYEFSNKAKELFKYFQPRPDINATLAPVEDLMILKNGALYEPGEDSSHEAGDWTAVMGCVPYRVSLDQLEGPTLPSGGIPDFVQKLSGVLFFNIGEVHINASREELKYSKATKVKLIEKINALIDEFVQHTMNEINNQGISIWEKRLRAQLLNKMELPVPDSCKDLTNTAVKLKKPADDELPYPFIVTQNEKMEEVTSVYVATDTRFIVKDDTRNITGYGLHGHNYIVRPRLDASVETVKAELNRLIVKSDLVGIPVIMISTLPWAAPIRPPVKQANKKHKVSQFILKGDKTFKHPYSEVWDIVEREPTAEDVYVILTNFRTCARRDSKANDIYYLYDKDQGLAELFDLELPTVYGYKSTEKKPVKPEDCLGTNYFEWRPKLLEQLLLLPNVKRWIDDAAWHDLISDAPQKKACEKLKKTLGETHPIYIFLKHHHKHNTNYNKLGWEKRKHIDELAHRVWNDKTPGPGKLALKALHDRYPLLQASTGWPRGIAVLWRGDYSSQWLEYVAMIDKQIPLIQPTTDGTPVLNIFDELFKSEDGKDDDDEASVHANE